MKLVNFIVRDFGFQDVRQLASVTAKTLLTLGGLYVLFVFAVAVLNG